MPQQIINSIAVLGCGWLGLPLAERLIKEGYSVKGSTTTETKLRDLKDSGIDPFLIKLENGEVEGQIDELFKNVELVIINIPPQLRKNNSFDYLRNLKALLSYIENSKIKKVIYISSTSVYKDTIDFNLVMEEEKYISSTEKSKVLIQAENLFLNNNHFETNVIRFSGLIGLNRHPAKYLSKMTDVKNPLAPVNLIHLEDCITLIRSMINHQSWNEVFNASYPLHPSRKEYYTEVCSTLKLPIPQFDNNGKNQGKIVSSEKVQKELGFCFSHSIY